MAKTVLQVVSRYRDLRYLCEDENGWYITGASHFVRYSTNKDDELTSIDFDGGPMVSVGGKLSKIHSGAPAKEITKITIEDEGADTRYRLHTDEN